MNQKPLTALVESVQKAAIRGRTQDGNQLWEVGATGVSIVHGFTHALQKRAVLICAVGPNGQESEVLPYDLMPSNNVLRAKVGSAVRSLVARVEGAQATTGEGLLQ